MVPVPLTYSPTPSTFPRLRDSCGTPVTLMISLNVTPITSVSPTIYTPSALEDETFVMAGTDPSTTIFLFADNDPKEPGSGSVKMALFPPLSLIIPPFKINAFVFV